MARPAFGQIAPALAAAPPPGSPLPFVTPTPPPRVSPPRSPVAPEKPVAVPNATVRISRVMVEGETVYPEPSVRAPLDHLVGPATPLAAIEAARAALLRRYRDDGYVLTAVSARIEADGTLRFLVTEGRIADVKLAGNIGPAGTLVLRFLKKLTETRPIDEATLERQLLLAQGIPGITLHAVLRPSSDEPGALTLIAEVSREKISGLATLDNYANPFTGPIESLGVFDLNSFTSLGEQTQVSIYHTWPNSQTFGQVSEQIYLGASGLKLLVYGGNGRVTPTGPLALEGYLGNTTVFGGTLTYPVIRTRAQSLNVFAAFDALDSEISIVSGGVRGLASDDQLRVLRLGTDYARSDLLLGGARTAVNIASLRLSHGLGILGASHQGAADAPRVGEDVTFTKLDGRISRTQTLFSPWAGSTVALEGLLAGQYSPDILPPAEQYYLGGFELTRGYYAGQVTGDKALAATAELQLNTSIPLVRIGLHHDLPTQFFVFYDWGETWQNQKEGLQERIASVGGGARIITTVNTEVDLLALTRFNRFPTGSGPNISPLRASGFYWRLLARF